MPAASIILNDDLRNEYATLFDTCVITDAESVSKAANRIKAGQGSHYNTLQLVTGVPWHVIGCIHFLESDCNFDTHLYNGDPLTVRTIHVPKDRPVQGVPPFTFEFSAVHALIDEGFTAWTEWLTIPGMLFMLEKYNGFGYRARSINTPYLWGCSRHYTGGMFVRDHEFDPTAVSHRPGCATIIKNLTDRGLI